MTVARISGNLPVAALPGRALRTALWVQNKSAANNIDVTFASGFAATVKPGEYFQRTVSGGGDLEGLQGAVTVTGTAGQPVDIEETYK